MTYQDHFSADALADHAEGLLGEAEAGRLEAHLAGCDDCRATSLLLAAIPDILAADDVGPMPAQYTARIEATLAALAAAEPVAPAGLASNVIPLASRRRVALVGLRRVGAVAAGVVLLIAGAALGIQTVGGDKEFATPTGDERLALPATRPTDQPGPVTLNKLPKAPKNATAGPRKGSKVGPDGTIYLKEGKVLFPDGTVVVAGKTENDPPIVFSPKRPKAASAPVPKPPRKGEELATAQGKGQPKIPDAAQPPAGTAQDPAAPVERAQESAKPVPADPGVPAAAATAPVQDSDRVGVAQADRAQASEDPYVSVSRSEYNEDNFAAKVMDLVGAARRHSATGSDLGTEYPPRPGAPRAPAAPQVNEPVPGQVPGTATDHRVPSSFAISQGPVQAPADAGRGPAEARFQDRVRRCAAQLGTKAIAGDIGLWREQTATIVIVPSESPDQVLGYVFYGNCDDRRPVAAATAQWEQRVNKPIGSPTPEPTPVRRVGSVHTAGGTLPRR